MQAIDAGERAVAEGRGRLLTYFEAITVAAFIAYRDAEVDAAVIEVGLGGRLDATNVLGPGIEVITPISYDHTERLGKTIELIASEKAGIIKPGGRVVVGLDPEDELQVRAIPVVMEKIRQTGARDFMEGRDFGYSGVTASPDGTSADVWYNLGGVRVDFPALRFNLTGKFQARTARLRSWHRHCSFPRWAWPWRRKASGLPWTAWSG